MIIYPVIELMGGGTVSVYYHRLDDPYVWHVDPVERAHAFVGAGAEWVHVTDLDAVRGDAGPNDAIIERIIREVGVPVQLRGPVTSDERVRRWFDAGVARLVVGRYAVTAPEWVKGLAKAYPDTIVVSVDIWKGKAMFDGWARPSMIAPSDIIHAYDGVPLAAMIVTDIDRALDYADAGFALTTKLAEETRTPVISSGLVSSLDDVSRLRYMPGIAGAMIGRALFDKRVNLAEAIEIARPVPERTAPFE
ncbi:MAG: HisA/HisF-related TIM barrel protein [Paracoccaceae bacterium]